MQYEDFDDDNFTSPSSMPSDLYGTGSGRSSTAPVALDPMKPRILLMGLRRGGKSSIMKVVFHKMNQVNYNIIIQELELKI